MRKIAISAVVFGCSLALGIGLASAAQTAQMSPMPAGAVSAVELIADGCGPGRKRVCVDWRKGLCLSDRYRRNHPVSCCERTQCVKY